MVNEFKLTVVHFARPNPMQFCACVENQDRASGPLRAVGRGPLGLQAAGPAFSKTPDRMQYFTILQYKVHSFNVQDDRSKHAWDFSWTVKKISKITEYIWPAGFRFCRASCSSGWIIINRVTLQQNKEFIMVLSICSLQKRLIRAAFWVPPASDVHGPTENQRHSD